MKDSLDEQFKSNFDEYGLDKRSKYNCEGLDETYADDMIYQLRDSIKKMSSEAASNTLKMYSEYTEKNSRKGRMKTKAIELLETFSYDEEELKQVIDLLRTF